MRVKATVILGTVAPDPATLNELARFLRMYRDATQAIIDWLWVQNRRVTRKELHDRFYRWLRSLGFRAHHASEIYKRAVELVKAARKNNGSKPVLKRLTARIHPWDYRLDAENGVVKIAVLNDRWVELKLAGVKRLKHFVLDGWEPKEILVKYEDERVNVYVVLDKDVEERQPRTIMGVDVNIDNVSYVVVDVNGRIVTAGVITFKGFRKALHLRKLAERLQKRLGRHWRFMKWSRRVYRRWMRRARNIVNDTTHLVAKRLVEIADRYDSMIVLEDLRGLKQRVVEASDRLAWLFTQFAYRLLQSRIEYKAAWKGLRVIYVSPRGTSKTSPLGRIVNLGYRWVLLPNGVATTRDIVAAWNLALRALRRMRGSTGSRGALIAPAMRG